PEGDVVIVGSTFSRNFPTTTGVLQPTFPSRLTGFFAEGYVVRIVDATADLALAEHRSLDTVTTDGAVALTLTATNTGPDTAAYVRVRAPIPEGTALRVASTTRGTWSLDAGTATFNLSSLASGASVIVHLLLVVTAQPGVTLDTSASVTATADDPNAAN